MGLTVGTPTLAVGSTANSYDRILCSNNRLSFVIADPRLSSVANTGVHGDDSVLDVTASLSYMRGRFGLSTTTETHDSI
jgi:hypothetical protein